MCRLQARSRAVRITRDRDEAVVDQIVERLLHVDIGRDHAGLLQRQARLQDGVALLRADAVEGQIGALLELDVDHGVRQLGHIHEDALLVVVIGQAIFARLLVDREHALGQVRIVASRKSSLELRMP